MGILTINTDPYKLWGDDWTPPVPPTPVPEEQYFTTEALEECTFTFTMTSKLPTTHVPYMSYSVDNGKTWTKVDNVDNEEVVVTTPTIAKDGKVLWKSEAVQFCRNTDPYPGSNIGYGKFGSSGEYAASGNIMSLLYGDDFKDATELKTLISTGQGAGTFCYLFNNSISTLISAENLILPALTLISKCYSYLFNGCTALKYAPAELPATTLAQNCYASMFYGCTALETAPVELPATTLENLCYNSMFYNCKSLVTAPTILATTLANQCCMGMFSGCIALKNVQEELYATTLSQQCYNSMFSGCTTLETAPSLPATALASQCYDGMFFGCSSLTSVKSMHLEWTSGATNNWLKNVAALGTFIKNPLADWTSMVRSESTVPENWQIQNNNQSVLDLLS